MVRAHARVTYVELKQRDNEHNQANDCPHLMACREVIMLRYRGEQLSSMVLASESQMQVN